MIDTQFIVFLAASLLLIITPGQDMILVMSRSIGQGAKAGVATAAGVSVGLLGHTILATLGLGAILRASEMLFVAVKIIGAGYLLYLGFRLMMSKQEEIKIKNSESRSLKTLFIQGALSNLSNPKIAIFYFAFLPQFIPENAANPTIMLLMLGFTFALLTFLVKAPIGYGAGRLSKWLRSKPAVQVWINRISGGVLIALGVRLAFEERM
jgi:threonine/homoserine/homoserine lactone efflux protein